MKLFKQIKYLFLAILIFLIATPIETLPQSATVPINITVKGALTISDAGNDSAQGKDPTINVDLEVTPDLGAAPVTKDANFRIRTNRNNWRLTAQRTSEVDVGPTRIKPTDISLLVTTQAGTKADASAGTLVPPFDSQTDLSQIPTSSPRNVISGTKKTSTRRDSNNTNNYFQVNTKYTILPDYLFQPGTWETTITYSLVSL